MSEKKTSIEIEQSRYTVIQSPEQEPRHRVGLGKTRRIAFAALQNAVVAGGLLFYSRSILGAVVRACVGA
jgi:hypothetical protein